MQKKYIIILSIGVVVGLIAVFLAKAYFTQIADEEERKAKAALKNAQQNQVTVMVARTDIPAGSVIELSMLDFAIVPRDYVQPQSASSVESVAGMIAVAPIMKGEQISLTRIGPAQMAKKRNLADMLPPGKRAIGVNVKNIEEIIDMINPGDYVDVIAVLPLPVEKAEEKAATKQTIVPVFQNVLVLAVGQDTAPQSKSSQREGKAPLITLALDPTEANLITFIQDQGEVRLSLRSGNDSSIETAQPVTWDNLFEYLPSLSTKEKEGESIEIYRGIKKEKIPLSK